MKAKPIEKQLELVEKIESLLEERKTTDRRKNPAHQHKGAERRSGKDRRQLEE